MVKWIGQFAGGTLVAGWDQPQLRFRTGDALRFAWRTVTRRFLFFATALIAADRSRLAAACDRHHHGNPGRMCCAGRVDVAAGLSFAYRRLAAIPRRIRRAPLGWAEVSRER